MPKIFLLGRKKKEGKICEETCNSYLQKCRICVIMLIRKIQGKER